MSKFLWRRSENDIIFDRLLRECQAKQNNEEKPQAESPAEVEQLRDESSENGLEMSGSSPSETERTPIANRRLDELSEDEANHDSPPCPIHSRSYELFEEMPTEYCHYENCQFYVSPDSLKKPLKLKYSAMFPNSKGKADSKRPRYGSLPLSSNQRANERRVTSREQERKSLPSDKNSRGRKKRNTKENISPQKRTYEESNEILPDASKLTETPRRSKRVSKKQLVNQSAAVEPTIAETEQTAKKKSIFDFSTDEEGKGNASSPIRKISPVKKKSILSITSDEEDETSTNPSAPKSLPRNSPEKRIEQTDGDERNLRDLEFKDPHEIGLGNKGNTCYVNATIQCLFAFDDFINHLNKLCSEKPDLNKCVESFNNLAMARQNGLSSEVDVLNKNFIASLGILNECYQNGNQQDAHEFLSRLLSLIRSEFPVPDNPVDQHFNFRITETFRCKSCQANKRTPLNHTSLCLPIPEESQTLEDCLKAYVKEEERCSKCIKCQGEKVAVSNRFDTIPNVLILTMNRYNNEGKVEKRVAAPDFLDLKELTIRGVTDTRLQKKAEIVHLGRTVQCGHYIAHILCNDGVWRRYDDREIRLHTTDLYGGDHPPYIYIYQKCFD